MKRMLSSCVSVLSVCVCVFAQAKAGGTQPQNGDKGSAQNAQASPEMNAAAVAELEESKRLSAMVVKLYGEGKYDEALKPARRALEIREKLLKRDDELVTSAVGNLASVYMGLKNFKEAEPLYQRLLPVYEKDYGAESQVIAQMLEVLAFLRSTKGDKVKAEEYYQRALALREKISGPTSKEVAQTLYNLAEFYQATENFKRAEPLYQRALDIREASLGLTDSKTIEARERYACLMRKTDRKKEAEALVTRGMVQSPPAGDGTDAGNNGPIEGGVLNGKALSLPVPVYPPEAGAIHVYGVVPVLVTINEEGRVIRVCALSGPAPLWRAAESAAAHSIFSPTKLSGHPVQVSGVIHYNFRK